MVTITIFKQLTLPSYI